MNTDYRRWAWDTKKNIDIINRIKLSTTDYQNHYRYNYQDIDIGYSESRLHFDKFAKFRDRQKTFEKIKMWCLEELFSMD